MIKKRYIAQIIVIAIICVIGGLFIRAKIVESNKKKVVLNFTPAESSKSKEEYVLIVSPVQQPMFIRHDYKALMQFGKDMKVKVSVEGPKGYDIVGEEDTIRKVIKRKPAGIMVVGVERSLTEAVNEAVEAGIPTVTVDADLPDSKRMAFVGSDWYEIGQKQAEAMVKLIGGKGKVAIMGIGDADNMQMGFEGFKSVIKNYPNIIYLGEFDDMASTEESDRLTEDLLKNYPDIAGIGGFDSESGPGIGTAIKRAKKVGKVKVTCVDIEPAQLKLCKEGVIQKLIGQKRELFTYYGARFLYDYNHATISLSPNDKKNKIYPIPSMIYTGLIEVDEYNVDSFLENNK